MEVLQAVDFLVPLAVKMSNDGILRSNGLGNVKWYHARPLKLALRFYRIARHDASYRCGCRVQLILNCQSFWIKQ
jgi:hypothetical protein